jgi:hypothetical protein
MLKGVQLQLRMATGGGTPAPVPRKTIEALDTVEVRVEPAQATFQLTFSVDRRSDMLAGFLPTDQAPVPARLVLAVTVNGAPDVLIDGLVTHQELNPGNAGSNATLTVTGEDLTVLMTKEELTGTPFAGMEPIARVQQIIEKYAQWGITPEVVRPAFKEAFTPAQATPQQHGHDLDYLRQLASAVGHVFYLRTTPQPGSTVAYWGPQVRQGNPQPPINVDLDSHTNADSLSFTFDQTQAEDPQARTQDPETKQSQIVTPPPPPAGQLLGRVQPAPFRRRIVSEAANRTPAQATMIAQGIAARTAESVTATGKLSVTRYGRLLRARELVTLRGSGAAFDGLWWVDSVTHEVKRDAYAQSFTLKRSALGSSIAQVPPP